MIYFNQGNNVVKNEHFINHTKDKKQYTKEERGEGSKSPSPLNIITKEKKEGRCIGSEKI